MFAVAPFGLCEHEQPAPDSVVEVPESAHDNPKLSYVTCAGLRRGSCARLWRGAWPTWRWRARASTSESAGSPARLRRARPLCKIYKVLIKICPVYKL